MRKFVAWLVFAVFLCCGSAPIPLSEYNTLESFYYATGGESWRYHSTSDVRWNFTDSNTSEPCNWDGISCICSSVCNVNKITLNYFNLEGYIPDLQNLTYLSKLSLHGNHLYGPLDGLSKLPLVMLSLHYNHIEGTLEPLRNISSLSYISLAYNVIEGNLTALSNMTSLEQLYLGSNLLNCTLHGIGSLRSLSRLTLSDNINIHGNLTQLKNLTNLHTLELSHNFISGDLSPISELHGLKEIEISGNYLSGSIEYVANLTNLLVLDLGGNIMSGSLSNLSDLIYVKALLLHQNYDIYGSIAQLSNLSKLEVLILYNTYIDGLMNDLTMFPLLKYTDLYNTVLFGSLYDIRNMTSLEYCDLSVTYITGNLADISGLNNMKRLYMYGSFIEGNIDAVNGWRYLTDLDLSYTLITGSLDNYLPSPTMKTLVLQDNLLTGQVPASIFDLLELEVLNLAQNCLFASLSGICNAVSLTDLIMDGLHSQSTCRKALPFKLVDTIYEAETVVSDVPGCLYSLPYLFSVRLGNNGVIGSLPADAILGENFTELVLTNNLMYSTIPHVFQNHTWTTLDLSYNRFTGTLLDSLDVSDDVILRVNRLSGKIPTSLYNSKNVNVLKNNLFACTPGELANLNDKIGNAYICGSNSFNYISNIWIVVIGTLAILFLLSTRNIDDGKDCWIGKCYYTIIKFLKRKVSHIKRMMNIREVVLSSKTMVSTENINKFILLARNIRWLCGITTGGYICVFMPLYSLFKALYFGSYYHQYAWTVSAAFISSKDVGITLFVIYVLALFVLFYYIRHTAADALVHSPKLPSSPKYYAVFGFIFAINLVFVVILSGWYVYILLHNDETIISIVEVCTSFFKVVWNNYILVSIVRYAEKNILKSKSHDCKELAIMFIVNNIFVPCLATSLVEPNCFFNMIDAPYITIPTFNYVVDFFFKSSTPVLTYDMNIYNYARLPLSWSYTYQCTSIILTSFATIFMYSCLFCTILPPILHYTKNKTIKNVRLFPDSYMSKVLNMFTTLVASYTGHELNVTRINEALVQRFVLQLVGSFTILFSFGVMIPLVGLVVFISIVGQTMYTEYCIGRYINVITKSNNLNQQEKEVLITQVDSEFIDLDLILLRSSWQILMFVGIFYGCFVFDMVGSEVGYSNALWAPVSLLVISIFLYASPMYFKSYIFITKQVARGKGSSRSLFEKSESAKFELTDCNVYKFSTGDSSGSNDDNKLVRISESNKSSRIVTIVNPMNSSFSESRDSNNKSSALPTHPSSDDTNRESVDPTITP